MSECEQRSERKKRFRKSTWPMQFQKAPWAVTSVLPASQGRCEALTICCALAQTREAPQARAVLQDPAPWGPGLGVLLIPWLRWGFGRRCKYLMPNACEGACLDKHVPTAPLLGTSSDFMTVAHLFHSILPGCPRAPQRQNCISLVHRSPQ